MKCLLLQWLCMVDPRMTINFYTFSKRFAIKKPHSICTLSVLLVPYLQPITASFLHKTFNPIKLS